MSAAAAGTGFQKYTHTHTQTLCQKIEQQKNEAVLDCTTTHAVPQNTKVRIVKKLT